MSQQTSQQSENPSDHASLNADDAQGDHTEQSTPTSTADEQKTAAQLPSPQVIQQQVEAVLMTIERPLTASKIAQAIGLDVTKPVNDAVTALNAFYEEHSRSFAIEKVAAGYQILTLPEHKDILAALHKKKIDNRLSPAALETLAIIAYKQPIIRANLESIRGVASGEIIRSLMDKHLVRIVGRAEEIGRPMLYGTSKLFLEVFGLSNLKDLPKAEELIKP